MMHTTSCKFGWKGKKKKEEQKNPVKSKNPIHYPGKINNTTKETHINWFKLLVLYNSKSSLKKYSCEVEVLSQDWTLGGSIIPPEGLCCRRPAHMWSNMSLNLPMYRACWHRQMEPASTQMDKPWNEWQLHQFHFNNPTIKLQVCAATRMTVPGGSHCSKLAEL